MQNKLNIEFVINHDDTTCTNDLHNRWYKDYDYIEYISKMMRGIIIPYGYSYDVVKIDAFHHVDWMSFGIITRPCDWYC